MNFEQIGDNEWVCGEYRIVSYKSSISGKAFDCYWRDTFIGGGWNTFQGAVYNCKSKAEVLKGAA